MSKGSILLVAMFLLAALLVSAQESQPKLSGRVTEADTGAPIEGATIALNPPFIAGQLNLQSAKTDKNGEYKIEKVVGGVYVVTASADGFVQQDYKADASPEGAFVRIGPSAHLQDISFKLEPEARIRGTVLDGQRKPVANVVVAAVRQEDAAKNHLVPIGSTETDADGRFALKGLPAGTYLVCANGPAGYGDSSTTAHWYRESWFGGTSSSKGAIPISLQPRSEHSGVQIIAEKEMRYRVIVWPSGPEGMPAPDRYDVTIQNRNHTSRRQADGSYVIPDIPPGHYNLISAAWSNVDYVGMGEQHFDVSDSDVSIHIHVGGLGEIAGTVQWSDAPAPTSQRALFLIESEEGAAQGVVVDAQGHFHVSRVLPGKYKFKPFQVNPPAEPQSVQCKGMDVDADSPLLIGDQEKVLDCKVTLRRPRINASDR